MCGIIGSIRTNELVDEQQLADARDLMAHRGPDDTGLSVDEGVGFGFRRLAILDLSQAGHQPMKSDDGRVTLVFNGEIYNFRELKKELALQMSFRSGTDSEVVLNGYIAWGWDELLRRIDGMFAFAIWDARLRTLFAARDRVGMKPFFYAHNQDGFCFASTLNALRVLEPTDAIDQVALDAYLTYQAVPAPMTLFDGLRQLEPAHALTFDLASQRLEINRYWDVAFSPKIDRPEKEVLDDLDELVHAAVRKRLMSDVPLGAFLSGGVDSSLVVSVMAKELSTPVEAVVMGFEDSELDERPFARKVAEGCGAHLHEHVLRPDAVRDLPEIIWQYGQPLADVSIVPTYYVARAAKQHVTVVLNGDGGDEVFGGYARPVVARAAELYRRILPRSIRRAVDRGLGPVNGHAGVSKHIRMLASAGSRTASEAFIYDRAFRSHRDAAYAPSLSGSVAGSHPDDLYRAVWGRSNGADDVDRALYGDFTTYLPDQLLAKMDVSTMAHSVEARSPLLDKDLIEYVARIPTSLKLRGYTTKYLLKRLAERYVPRDVLYRRKRGFVMPAGDWLRGELAPFARALLLSTDFLDRGWIDSSFVRSMLSEHESGAGDWGEQIWTLFVLEIWARLCLDGTLTRTDSLEVLT